MLTVYNAVLYEFLRKAAAHTLNEYEKVVGYRGFFAKIKYKAKKFTDDEEVLFIEYWLRKNTVSKQVSVKPIKWASVRRFLQKHGIEYFAVGNKVILSRKYQHLFIFSRTFQREYNLTGAYCYPNMLKTIRNDFDLKREDGVDDNTLLDEDAFIDDTIIAYKKVIYRLSLT